MPRNIATIGAALTILALPMDALIQSAIRMPSKLELVEKLRNSPPEFQNYRNLTFLRRSSTYATVQIMTDFDNIWPEVTMVNAIQYGVGYSLGLAEFMQITDAVYCPTGYCEFPQMQTLDIESACRLRHDVEFIQGDADTASYETLPGTDLALYADGYTLDNGYDDSEDVANQQIAVQSYSTWPRERTEPAYPTDNYERNIFNWTLSRPLITRTSMLINRQGVDNGDTRNSTYGIECALYCKVKTTTGYLNDTSKYNLAWDDDTSIETNFAWINTSTDANLALIPSKCIVDGDQVPHPNESSYNDTFFKDNCIYWVPNKTNVALQAMLKHPWYGLNGDLKLMRTIPDTDQSVLNERNSFMMNLEVVTRGTPNQTLFGVADIWQNMAYFAGNTVRNAKSVQSNGSLTNLGVQGTMSDLVTYYSVDWARLSVPAFIVLSCALFMVYTAVHTRREYAWRRSALPLLFHGLEDHERHAQGDVRDFNAMQDAAKNIRVRLTEHVDDTGARLTTQK
jgi:hypothetical protein